MGFHTEDLAAMVVTIDHTSRDASGYSSLQVNLKRLKYSLDDHEIQAEIQREWTNHGSQNGQQLAVAEDYLRERYGFRVTATPYDAERYRRKPTEAQRESLVSYPFFTYTVQRGRGRLFPWRWVRTEVFPFIRLFHDPASFDVFGFENPWEFSGGATRPMAEDVLDAAPAQWVGRPPMWPIFHKRLDGIIITVDIVDLAVSGSEVVATLEDHWGGNLFGNDEDPHPRPARRRLQR